jgi:putative effector of murein hydrolase LrgA (UPF0299 family)
VTVGGVLGEAWQLYTRFFRRFFVVAIIVYLVVNLSLFSFLGSFLRYWIGGAIASSIVGPFLAVALTLTYFRLRELEGGSSP